MACGIKIGHPCGASRDIFSAAESPGKCLVMMRL